MPTHLPAIERLARTVAELAARDIPDRIMARAEDCVLDVIGSAAAGIASASVPPVAATADCRMREGTATTWFAGTSRDAAASGFVNAMAATALDVDDGHRLAAGHPGAAVIAAAMAVAQERGAGAEDFLAAVVLGYEAAVRIAIARYPAHHESTVSGRWCGTGSAAAAARLMGLASPAVADAVLIAENHAPRLSAASAHGFAGSHVKEGIAWATLTGILAVDLARYGFRGYPATFDQDVLYDPALLIDGLGERFAIDGLFFKPYACCRWIHAAIDALLSIMDSHGIEAAAIEAIAVDTFTRAAELGNSAAPRLPEEAQFSIPFILGAAAIAGRDALLPFDEGLIGRRDVEALAHRVTINVDPTLDKLFPAQTAARVHVRADGETHTRLLESPFGDPGNPMDRSALQAKFRRLTARVLDRDRAEGIISAADGLREKDLQSLIELLRAPLGGVHQDVLTRSIGCRSH